ncbi:MAG: hypothetical protein AAGB07_18950 [Pseudomonadota bacterium]
MPDAFDTEIGPNAARLGSFTTWINARPCVMRWMLAGPVTLIVTLAIMAGMTAWWPQGAASIDQIGMPLILSPVIWVCVFLYALLEEHLGRGWLVMLGLIFGNGGLLTMG